MHNKPINLHSCIKSHTALTESPGGTVHVTLLNPICINVCTVEVIYWEPADKEAGPDEIPSCLLSAVGGDRERR